MRTNSTKAANHVKPILRIFIILAILVQTIAFTACNEKDKKPGEGGDAKQAETDAEAAKAAEEEAKMKAEYEAAMAEAEKAAAEMAADMAKAAEAEAKEAAERAAAKAECGGVEYYTEKKFCFKDKVYDKCGFGNHYKDYEKYNPETHFCIGYLVELCGGKEYDPTCEECVNGNVQHKGWCDGDAPEGQ